MVPFPYFLAAYESPISAEVSYGNFVLFFSDAAVFPAKSLVIDTDSALCISPNSNFLILEVIGG